MSSEHEILTRVSALRMEVDRLVATSLDDLDAAQGAALYRELRVTTDRVQGFAARMLARVEADGRWSAGDARTFPEWASRHDLTSVGGARRDAVLGRALEEDLPATAEALAAGEVSAEHAQVLARLATTSDARRAALRSDSADQNEAFLLERARRLPVEDYRREVKRWATQADSTASEREHEHARAKEYLTFARRDDGVALQGFLTVEHGTALATALRAVAGVPSADDDRSPEQRRAAALADLSRLVLDRGLAGGGSQVRPHLSVHVSWETMQRLAVEHPQGRGGADGTGPLDPGGRPVGPPAELDDGEPIPASVLARLTCDSEISRIVFGPKGQVLDVGRSERTYSGQLRRAVIARDRHCRYPRCTAPAMVSEVHHTVPWARGGRTSVRTGVLLCWFHHELIHRRQISVTATGDGGWCFTRPDGTELRHTASPGTSPPGPRPPGPEGAPPSRPPEHGPPATSLRRPAEDRAATASAPPDRGTAAPTALQGELALP